jgi:hypothetical protein
VSCAGGYAGVKTEALDTVIRWATLLYDTDLRADGRNGDMLDFADIQKLEAPRRQLLRMRKARNRHCPTTL